MCPSPPTPLLPLSTALHSPTCTLTCSHTYAQVHLFDIDIPGKITFKESLTLTAGKAQGPTSTRPTLCTAGQGSSPLPPACSPLLVMVLRVCGRMGWGTSS